MEKLLNSVAVKSSLQRLGWTQKHLAKDLGVSAQAITNYLKGTDFPRPPKLLRLATLLELSFDQLVQTTTQQPVIAFRKKAGSKTTDEHILKAMAMGALLRPLTAYLPELQQLRTQLPSPSTDYATLHLLASQVRTRLGIGATAALSYQTLINEFDSNAAVIIPVLWGEKKNHKNALHILLPNENVTFVFVNLDTRIEDFKFWMAHELAHVYTPNIAGTEAGEDFADAFAGALLFPKAAAVAAYEHAAVLNKTKQLEVLKESAAEYGISLFSVYSQINQYAASESLGLLKHSATEIHAIRNIGPAQIVSDRLFSPMPPAPEVYIASTRNLFRSNFFAALQKMLKTNQTGAGYVQQILDIPMQDAIALHAELMR